MPFITPPASYNAQSKLYMQRLYNSIAQDIRNATSVPIVDSMPVNPKQGAYYFQNAVNGSSVITKAGLYGYDGNQWIGNMDEQQWDNTRIESVAVNKLLAGTIGAIEIVLANSTNSIIRSANYSAGSAGWAIRGNGNAEFQNVTVRGTLNASDLIYGTIAEGRFGDNTVGAGPVKSGNLHRAYGGVNSGFNVPYDAAVLTAGTNDHWTGLTIPANSHRTAVLLIHSLTPTVTATQDGYLVIAFAKNAANQSNVMLEGRMAMKFANTFAGTVTGTYYDLDPGTGSVVYYFGKHHSMKPSPQTLTCAYSIVALEISK